MDSSWKKVDIFTTSEGIEDVSSALYDLGHHSISVVDAADLKNLMDGKYGAWDYIDPDLMKLREVETTITLYIPNDEQGQDRLNEIQETLVLLKAKDANGTFGRLECALSNVKNENWADAWKDDYDPIDIGDNLIICSSWADFDPKERKALIIDPGMAFGTGLDETTRLCLEVLDHTDVNGFTVLDIGCGSGILAIGALLLGAESAFGIDIDETAVKTAKENAEQNGVAEKSVFICGDPVELVSETYDIVCANISADVILSLMSELPRFLKNDGVIILSGIIENREQDIIDALLDIGFSIVERNEEKGWSCVVAKV